ncbi:MAG: hypothetical protein HOP07_11600 [Bacteriovoracaceae bacterium]|nr:hypothetical protein [Bacteriovoracaceae bacterium]
MQGLPINLLTPVTANKEAGKVESSTKGLVNGIEGSESNAEGKNGFASFLSNLFGTTEEVQAGSQAATLASETKPTNAQAAGEAKVDLLLHSKSLDQKVNKEFTSLTTEQALPVEVVNNLQKLLVTTEKDKATDLSGKITSTSNNLEELLKTLKGESAPTEVSSAVQVENSGEETTVKEKSNLLDFLVKESKSKTSGDSAMITNGEKTIGSEASSKLGLSSEDFLSQLDAIKSDKSEKLDKNILNVDSEGNQIFDPKLLLSKQMNQSMKTYGQKQELLSGNLIKNTKDLAFKDVKSKGSIDELTSPDLKVANDLSQIKESFIPQMSKSENNSNIDSNTTGKVLDLSKINTSNTNEIIKRISDYVEQRQVANKDSLDLVVKHDSLGQFKIQVNRPVGGNNLPMDMQITTSTAEGHDFFVKNEIGLMKNLSQAGIQLSDLRIVSGGESMSFAQNDSKNSHNSQNNGQTQKEFMNFESGDSSQGSQRRRELWQEARANQQRYGA